MVQKFPLAFSKRFHVHEWKGEGGGGRETERIGGFMRGNQGRERPQEKRRKFYTTAKPTDTNLREAQSPTLHTHLVRHCL